MIPAEDIDHGTPQGRDTFFDQVGCFLLRACFDIIFQHFNGSFGFYGAAGTLLIKRLFSEDIFSSYIMNFIRKQF